MTSETVPPRSRLRRFLDLTLVRMVVAIFATALAGGLATAFVGEAWGRRFHEGWPEACGALASLAAYALYVRAIEHRPVGELGGRGAAAELMAGLAAGGAMVGAIIAALWLAGAWRLVAAAPDARLLAIGFAQMAFVAVLEELLSRAIVLRLAERALGSWAALALSSLVFGLAHLPGNAKASVLSFAIVVVAGAFLGAAYFATRRLWLCIGLHAGWNFTLGHVFAIAVSGHPATPGAVAGRLAGPDWLTGGAYGLEASVLTLVVLLLVAGLLLQRAVVRGHVHGRASRVATRQVVAASPGP
jgi:membrane protease YdiL (CAAX protease family)